MSTETNTALDNAIIGMAEAAFEAVKATSKETGVNSRGAVAGALLMAAAFVCKPEDCDGSEDPDTEITALVQLIMMAQGPRGLYELLRTLSYLIQAPLYGLGGTDGKEPEPPTS